MGPHEKDSNLSSFYFFPQILVKFVNLAAPLVILTCQVSTFFPDPGEIRKSGSASSKKHRELEEVLIATQLDRLPSYFRKVFELKTKGNYLLAI